MKDIQGVERGACSCGECPEFISGTGPKCGYCECSPIRHAKITKEAAPINTVDLALATILAYTPHLTTVLARDIIPQLYQDNLLMYDEKSRISKLTTDADQMCAILKTVKPKVEQDKSMEVWRKFVEALKPVYQNLYWQIRQYYEGLVRKAGGTVVDPCDGKSTAWPVPQVVPHSDLYWSHSEPSVFTKPPDVTTSSSPYTFTAHSPAKRPPVPFAPGREIYPDVNITGTPFSYSSNVIAQPPGMGKIPVVHTPLNVTRCSKPESVERTSHPGQLVSDGGPAAAYGLYSHLYGRDVDDGGAPEPTLGYSPFGGDRTVSDIRAASGYTWSSQSQGEDVDDGCAPGPVMGRSHFGQMGCGGVEPSLLMTSSTMADLGSSCVADRCAALPTGLGHWSEVAETSIAKPGFPPNHTPKGGVSKPDENLSTDSRILSEILDIMDDEPSANIAPSAKPQQHFSEQTFPEQTSLSSTLDKETHKKADLSIGAVRAPDLKAYCDVSEGISGRSSIRGVPQGDVFEVSSDLSSERKASRRQGRFESEIEITDTERCEYEERAEAYGSPSLDKDVVAPRMGSNIAEADEEEEEEVSQKVVAYDGQAASLNRPVPRICDASVLLLLISIHGRVSELPQYTIRNEHDTMYDIFNQCGKVEFDMGMIDPSLLDTMYSPSYADVIQHLVAPVPRACGNIQQQVIQMKWSTMPWHDLIWCCHLMYTPFIDQNRDAIIGDALRWSNFYRNLHVDQTSEVRLNLMLLHLLVYASYRGGGLIPRQLDEEDKKMAQMIMEDTDKIWTIKLPLALQWLYKICKTDYHLAIGSNKRASGLISEVESMLEDEERRSEEEWHRKGQWRRWGRWWIWWWGRYGWEWAQDQWWLWGRWGWVWLQGVMDPYRVESHNEDDELDLDDDDVSEEGYTGKERSGEEVSRNITKIIKKANRPIAAASREWWRRVLENETDNNESDMTRRPRSNSDIKDDGRKYRQEALEGVLNCIKTADLELREYLRTSGGVYTWASEPDIDYDDVTQEITKIGDTVVEMIYTSKNVRATKAKIWQALKEVNNADDRDLDQLFGLFGKRLRISDIHKDPSVQLASDNSFIECYHERLRLEREMSNIDDAMEDKNLGSVEVMKYWRRDATRWHHNLQKFVLVQESRTALRRWIKARQQYLRYREKPVDNKDISMQLLSEAIDEVSKFQRKAERRISPVPKKPGSKYGGTFQAR